MTEEQNKELEKLELAANELEAAMYGTNEEGEDSDGWGQEQDGRLTDAIEVHLPGLIAGMRKLIRKEKEANKE